MNEGEIKSELHATKHGTIVWYIYMIKNRY